MEFCKNGAVGALERRRLEKPIVDPITVGITMDPVSLLIPIVVADVEHRAGIDAIGEQEVEAEFLVKAVVLADVPEQKPVCELIGRQGAEDVCVKN